MTRRPSAALRRGLACLAVACSTGALAQQGQTGTGEPDFSDAGRASTPAALLSERLQGKVLVAKFPMGPSWRLEFRPSGQMFINLSTGPRDSGRWRTEDGRLCVTFAGNFPSGCGEWRVAGDKVWVMRNADKAVAQVVPD